MPSHPLLFDLGALQTHDSGCRREWSSRAAPTPSTDAQRRADLARYQEVACRSALNPVKGCRSSWTLNPMRGCTHGCHYCFARRYHSQFEMNSDDEFASVILVKQNIVGVLARELDRPVVGCENSSRSARRPIPYQPIEGHYKSRGDRSRR